MTLRTLLAALAACALAAAAFAQAQPADAPAAKPPEAKPAPQEDKLVHVLMSTSAGDIVLELNETKAPGTVKNFLSYVDKEFYSGTIFHRVISNFMIQGGGHTADWKQKPTDPKIKNEWKNGLRNVKHTIAMARIGGDPDSATSQFFINVADNAMLDRPQADGAAYCVFGKVVGGVETVEKIRTGKVGPAFNGENSKPAEPVTITTVKRLSADEYAKWKDSAGKPRQPEATPAPKKDDK